MNEVNSPMPRTEWMNEALERLSATLVSKNADYSIDGGEFSNFEYAAHMSEMPVDKVMLAQIGIKVGRLKGLPDDPSNESRLDTIKDLAGYAVILYAYSLFLETT